MAAELDPSESPSDEIARYVRTNIARGLVLPGEPLPTARELADVLSCDKNTVQRAYKALQEEGLIYARIRQGYFVADSAKQVAAATQRALRARVDRYILMLKREGFAEGDIAAALRAGQKGLRA